MNLGIICEFNPLHSGHKHLIQSAKKSKDDCVICAMSGNFVQRAEPAVYNKYERARVAVENGADLVIEIPTLCSTQSAQGFAKAGVSILEATGVCNSIAFGAECDNVIELKRIAQEVIDKDEQIKKALASGVSYPTARRIAVDSPILDSPNNILAIEYLTYTKLEPIAIKRIGKGHDTDDEVYSASKIREGLPLDEICSLKNCESAVLYKLRTMSAQDFKQIDDVAEGLENRIVEAIKTARNLEELYDSIKTKRYTHSRIRRIILRAYLGITKDMPKAPQYLHILAFNDKGKELLSEMKKRATLPIITKYANASGEIKDLYDMECKFTDIYNLGYKIPKPCATEQTSKIVII
jgi:predicted nucleotidyltransferase